MSDGQLANELQGRNVLAERISSVLRQRQMFGAERTQKKRVLTLQQRPEIAKPVLRGTVAHPESVPQAVSHVHAKKLAEFDDKRYVVQFRWNSANGSTV